MKTRMTLSELKLSEKVLYTGYLLVMGVGILMAILQIFLTHGMADGEIGVSVDDVVYSYHGNRNSSQLEAKLNGSMKDKANDLDRAKLIKWVRDGATEKDYKEIQPIFENNCIACHSSMESLAQFNTYEETKDVTSTDEGASIDSLTRVSHIHLFGIAFIFIFVGYIFTMSVGLSEIMKSIIISLPFAFLIVDISSWWVTSIFPAFAWLTIIGGFGYMMAFAVMWFVSMYQMWLYVPQINKN